MSNISKILFDVLLPIRNWIDRVKIDNERLAIRVCELIPAQCPFERNITIFGHLIIHIPPLCKLNPLYEELVSLRFRALCYLADECEAHRYMEDRVEPKLGVKEASQQLVTATPQYKLVDAGSWFLPWYFLI